MLPRGAVAPRKLAATVATTRGGGATTTVTAVGEGGNPIATLQNFGRSIAQTVADARSHLAAAAVARGASIFAMYPVDTIKTRLQMKQADAFRLAGLYGGVAGSLFGQIPYGVLTFGSYEMYKQSLLERFPDTKPGFIYAMAAVMGDVTGSGWLCPSEVMKQQIQAGIYPSTKEAISGIFRKNGFGGFYQGFLGGLARDVPFRVAQLTTFEMTKSFYLRAKQQKRVGETPITLSPIEAAICGAAAGSFSAAITNPLDRIKTLLMTDTTNAYGGSVAACASKILADEGAAGFFAGVVPRVALIAPSVCIFFVAYELAQQRFNGED